jgi:hypothetical protein
MMRIAISVSRCILKKLLPICVCLTERRAHGVGPHDYRPETAPQLMFYTPQEGAITCRHNHIR